MLRGLLGTAMRLSGRHVQDKTHVTIDGRRAAATVICVEGTLPNCALERIEARLEMPPERQGIHFLELQNPGGLFGNEFIFHRSQLATVESRRSRRFIACAVQGERPYCPW